MQILKTQVMNNFFEELKKYFEETPHSKVLEDWAKSEVFDSVGPTVEDFISNSQKYHVHTVACDYWGDQNINSDMSPKYSSGLFFDNYFPRNAKSGFFN